MEIITKDSKELLKDILWYHNQLPFPINTT